VTARNISTKGGNKMMDNSMIRIVCAVLAVLFLGIIVLRRKKSAD